MLQRKNNGCKRWENRRFWKRRESSGAVIPFPNSLSARRKGILAIVHYKFRKKCPSKGLVDRDWQRRRVRNTAGCFAYTVLALYLRNLRCDFENMCVRMKKIPLHIDQTCDGNGAGQGVFTSCPSLFFFANWGCPFFYGTWLRFDARYPAPKFSTVSQARHH